MEKSNALERSAAEHASALHLAMVREKNRVAMTSVVAAVVLTSMKLGIGLWTGSLGILSEAAHSGLDFLAAVITWVAVSVADRPPDKEHHFGHGKVENFSALIETLLLFITCGWILYEAWHRLVGGSAMVDVNVYSFVIMVVSIAIDFTRSRALLRVARKYNSQALEADAIHFSSDIYSSAVVIVGLICVLAGFPAGDAIAASVVAMIVIWISIRLGKRTVDTLLDRVPDGVQEKVEAGIASVDGVREIRSLRIRQAGGNTFIDTSIGIHRLATFDQSHSIMDAVEHRLAELFPRADVIVHAEPVIDENEEPRESVLWLVQQAGLSAHNILVLSTGNAYHVELDIEYPAGTSFKRAHELASEVEASIRNQVPRVKDVAVHLEEEATHAVVGEDVSESERELVASIRSAVNITAQVHACGRVRCFKTPTGIKVAVGCSVNGALSLIEAHDIVNAIETAISDVDPRIVKVFIHAGPG